jgi:hypothetical protein
LDSSEDGLSGSQDTVCEDHRHSEHTNALEDVPGDLAALKDVADSVAALAQVVGHVTIHLDHGCFTGIAIGDVGVAGEESIGREGTTFAVVVAAEDDDDVFEGNHHEEGPDDEGEGANEILF